MIRLEFDSNNKVIAQRNDAQVKKLDAWPEYTDHPDGPDFMGRTLLPNGSFTPPIPVVKSRREELKEIRDQRPWTPVEFQEAIAELL